MTAFQIRIRCRHDLFSNILFLSGLLEPLNCTDISLRLIGGAISKNHTTDFKSEVDRALFSARSGDNSEFEPRPLFL
jgi:hypothetical protein